MGHQIFVGHQLNAKKYGKATLDHAILYGHTF